MARIISFTGPSGSGKSTLAKGLIAKHAGKVSFMESITTRLPRTKEEQASGEYRFVSIPEFEQMREHDEFLWYVTHNDVSYGTRKEAVGHALQQEERVTLMILVPQVLGTLYDFIIKERRAHGDVSDAWVACYLNPPDPEELSRRLMRRGDTDEMIRARAASESNWFNEARKCGKSLQLLHGSRTVSQNIACIEHFLHLHHVA